MKNYLKPVAHSFDVDHGLSDEKLTAYLGGKGANLNIIKRLGLPVPPGFTIPTPFCEKYLKKHKLTPVMEKEVRARIAEMESEVKRGFGNPSHPLLLSVRSGAPVSMPGMMDTVLNLGLTEASTKGLAKKTDELFALDCYRRFLHMFGTTVRGWPDHYYSRQYNAFKALCAFGPRDLQLKAMWNMVRDYRKVEEISNDPYEQLGETIVIVFKSWQSDRAIAYRDHYGIDHNLGTAVTVQMMVFGNYNDRSGTGVLFSRDPNTGENTPVCNYLPRAQGEDVVSGKVQTQGLDELRRDHPECCEQLLDYAVRILEPRFRDTVDVEFTIEDGKLYILQVRRAKPHPSAERKILMGLLDSEVITPREFNERWANTKDAVPEPQQSKKKSKPRIVVAKGEGCSPGVVWGAALLNPSHQKQYKNYILIRRFTEPDDVPVMLPAGGIATAEGGSISHAAIIARSLGTPCVVGAKFAVSGDTAIMPNGHIIREGDTIGVDGKTGEIFVEGASDGKTTE